VGVFVIYKSSSDHARSVEEFLREFKRRTSRDLETVDPESRQGADFCRTYDIVEYPSVIALSETGQILSMWRGIPMPLIDEVSFYVL
jgi:hypothetical protein